MINRVLNGPIPGESLTKESKSVPWEQPAKFSDPEKALEAHLNRLSNDGMIGDALKLMELGFPIKAMTESILTGAVMNGMHSIDISLIIAPVIQEYLVSMAKEAGIDYVTGFEKGKDNKEREHLKAMIEKKLSQDTESPEEDKLEGIAGVSEDTESSTEENPKEDSTEKPVDENKEGSFMSKPKMVMMVGA
jgi:hypothetical protein